MSSTREEILRRIAAAGGGAAAAPPRAYRRAGTLDAPGRVDLFCRRVADYRADVLRIPETTVAGTVGEICRERGARTLVVPLGLPEAWRPEGIDLVADRGLSPRELDHVAGVLTACTAAIAESGTVVLAGGPAEGRRALTLVPDLHICVVREAQVVELLPEALDRLAAENLESRPITFVSGPSATSDIELSRVEGVHGPRTLVVLVTSRRHDILHR